MTPWQGRAACAGKPTAWFFAESTKGRPGKIPLDPYARARALCADCPVRNECLDWAMSRNEWGFLGGMSQLERQALKRRQQRSRKAEQARDTEATRLRLHAEGLTDPHIGAQVGKSATAIREWRIARGLAPNTPGVTTIPAWRLALYEQMWDAGLTDEQIAEGTKTTPQAVKGWRRRSKRARNTAPRTVSA